jgi:hypothetical protein
MVDLSLWDAVLDRKDPDGRTVAGVHTTARDEEEAAIRVLGHGAPVEPVFFTMTADADPEEGAREQQEREDNERWPPRASMRMNIAIQ